jgi:isopenicillin-N epimerase
VPLVIDELAPAWYVGNCHKWISAPKGAGFLWARADKRESTRPVVIGHGANMPVGERSRFRQEFDWVGTDDPTAWLCVPRAIEVMGGMLPGGWPALMERNRELVLSARRKLCAALEIPEPAPASMIGSLAAVPLPDGPAGEARALYSDPLQDRLWMKDRIEVPIGPWPAPPRRLLRLSAQLYNRIEQYDLLLEALQRELALERSPN